MKSNNPFTIPFDSYLKLSKEKAKEIQFRALEAANDWIDEQLDKLDAEWIVVCGKKVVKWSNDPDEFPSIEKIKEIGEQYNLIPFVFSKPPIVEESIGNTTAIANDYYPTLKFNVRGNGQTKSINGDFDTGASRTILNLDDLLNLGIVFLDPYLDTPNQRIHLGKSFT